MKKKMWDKSWLAMTERWIPACAGMTEETDSSDKSDPYISEIDRRDACPTDGMGLMNQTPTSPPP